MEGQAEGEERVKGQVGRKLQKGKKTEKKEQEGSESRLPKKAAKEGGAVVVEPNVPALPSPSHIDENKYHPPQSIHVHVQSKNLKNVQGQRQK